MTDSNYECIVIGGSHAGLSAALVLGRSIRRTLVIDADNPRNRPSKEAHNFYSRDGQSPMDLITLGKEQLAPYKTVEYVSGVVTSVRAHDDGFEVDFDDGAVRAKTLILATGASDGMLDVPGFAEFWGNRILHCPYCHGYEAMGSRVGYVTPPGTVAQYNTLLKHWYDDLVMFTNGQEFSAEELQRCADDKVRVVDGTIRSLTKASGGITVTTDAEALEVGYLYWDSDKRYNTELAEQLGCALVTDSADGKVGAVMVDQNFGTSVEGVWAIGDLSAPIAQVAAGAYAGVKAVMAVNEYLWQQTCG